MGWASDRHHPLPSQSGAVLDAPSPAERGRCRWGWRLGRERRRDRFDDAIKVGQHLVVREAKDAKATPCKPSGAPAVLGSPLPMLAAVDFDHEARSVTNEVDAMNGPIGAWRRKWQPARTQLRRSAHSSRSAIVASCRNLRARATWIGWRSIGAILLLSLMEGSGLPPHPHLRLPRSAGEGASRVCPSRSKLTDDRSSLKLGRGCQSTRIGLALRGGTACSAGPTVMTRRISSVLKPIAMARRTPGITTTS